jgi:(E)-4-hydroxy-3-methylbut-2-enyl-diphosphate synthase
MRERRTHQLRRRKTLAVKMGSVTIGGDAPITVQSMTNTDTRDLDATTRQTRLLEEAGCEIVRVAVPDEEAASNLSGLRESMTVPLVADIHFDYKLALGAIASGVDGLRINPGNIGDASKVREVVRAAKDSGIPIRIGVNAGSLEKDILGRYGEATAEGMVESALRHISILERESFQDIIVSMKASDVRRTVDAHRMLAARCDYPFHLGITEAGTLITGAIKSAVGIGILLEEGIGDTIRVSLSAPPEEEVRVGFKILKALGLRRRGISVVACPTCARAEFDVPLVADEIERLASRFDRPLTVAVMGCVVNGPGEAREADLGVVGTKTGACIYIGGGFKRKVLKDDIVSELMRELENLALSG